MIELLGIDIGGTKCAVICGQLDQGGNMTIVEKSYFPTNGLRNTLDAIFAATETLVQKHGEIAAVGISCGGPLDNRRGIIMSPPNLPGWDDVHIVEMIGERFGLRAALENDANACALAEWKFGAGRGCNNVIFLTFGTGLGAGIILDGRLYAGTNGNAGEIGHIRLSDFGPVGYGKAGSFEGFCSGGGIAQMARAMAMEQMQMGRKVGFCPSLDTPITARSVAEAADRGDELAREVFAVSGRFLGKGLSILIDTLNPEVIVIGSIYVRSRHLLEEHMLQALGHDALPFSAGVCRIVPAALDEHIGDYAALSIAANIL
ncbi:N-acylmannosamine kinase [Bacteroidia bacterium]|nr:N-acylmannosamine kinase [Bacteroidia bacterium]